MEATRDHSAFVSIVVGTDGSERAGKAVRKATDLARSTGARLEVVSAYRPVPEQRLREQRKDVPEKYRWMVNPREEVDAILREAVDEARATGSKPRARPGRLIPPQRFSTSPRSSMRTSSSLETRECEGLAATSGASRARSLTTAGAAC